MEDNVKRDPSRRRMLKLIGTSGAIGIAGCGGRDNDQPLTSNPTKTSTDTATRTPTNIPTDTATETETETETETTAEGNESPDVSIVKVDVTPEEVESLYPVDVIVILRNQGNVDGKTNVPLVVDGNELRSRVVQVRADEKRSIQFVFRPPTKGRYSVGTVGDTTEVEATQPMSALPFFKKPSNILDSAPVPTRKDRLLANTIQGIVNSRQPRIFFEVGTDWEQTLGIRTNSMKFWELIGSYSEEVAGIVVYDPRRPHTINAATTVAGVERAVVSAPSQLSQLKEMGLRVKLDFRELNDISQNSINLYKWLIDEYWERTADRIMVGLPPTRNGGQEPAWQFRDYAVAVKALTVWLDARIDSHASLLSSITSRMPTPGVYLGWWPDEVSGIKLASKNGLYTGATDFMDSGTFWSGTAPRKLSGWPSRQNVSESPGLNNEVYVTFTITEGDNIQYCQNRMKTIWEDPNRGEFPINWSVSPLLADISPGILSYYFQTSTKNDHFMCGPSGIGYAYPKDWPTSEIGKFTNPTGRYLDSLQIDTLYALNRLGVNSSFSQETIEAIQQDTDIRGIALGWDGPETTIEGDNIVVSHGIGGLGGGESPEDIKSELINSIPEDWSNDEPIFRSVGMSGWDFGPADIVKIAKDLNRDFEIVRGDVYFDLVRQALSS